MIYLLMSHCLYATVPGRLNKKGLGQKIGREGNSNGRAPQHGEETLTDTSNWTYLEQFVTDPYAAITCHWTVLLNAHYVDTHATQVLVSRQTQTEAIAASLKLHQVEFTSQVAVCFDDLLCNTTMERRYI